MRLHLALAVLIPLCAALCDWQVHRALSGNSLSWAYVFEWPFFAGYGVFMWWRLLREEIGVASPAPSPIGAQEGREADSDEEMAAYNRYLAELQVSGRPKRW